MPGPVDVQEFSQSMMVDSAEDAAPESSISSDEYPLEEADSDDDYFPPYLNQLYRSSSDNFTEMESLVHSGSYSGF
ncbi:hypothetical protein BLNAU_12197 [Blattamonas nauphoetae]|uniref:Uncharacterized protein n=1 Tax=Blattamonas nauphoetae TaxID=2049346 RepID=A0ABQ9XLF9_9EUKA|nr:hypothetical protein BLNAU_12197 [Blattamonas nauphoetae]